MREEKVRKRRESVTQARMGGLFGAAVGYLLTYPLMEYDSFYGSGIGGICAGWIFGYLIFAPESWLHRGLMAVPPSLVYIFIASSLEESYYVWFWMEFFFITMLLYAVGIFLIVGLYEANESNVR